MSNTIDLRVVKTLENIKNGFAECIRQKPFSSVSVSDISEAAKINRSTFYKYYLDKYELRDRLIKTTLKELSDNITLEAFQFENSNLSNAQAATVKQLQYMYSQKDWYLLLWNKNLELYVFEDMARLF